MLSLLHEKLYITKCFFWCCPTNNGWSKGKKIANLQWSAIIEDPQSAQGPLATACRNQAALSW